EHGDIEAECGFLSIPRRRLPHGEPFTGNHHEAEEPDEEGKRRRGDDVGFCPVETRGWCVTGLEEADSAGEIENAGDAFGDNDGCVSCAPEHRIGDRPVHQRVAGISRVHAHHVLHEQVVRAVIGYVVEGDEQAKGGKHQAHDDLGIARDQHDKPGSPVQIISLGELRQSSLAIGRQRCLVALEAAELTAVTVFHASAIGSELLLDALKGLSPTARYAPAFRHEIGPPVGFDGSDLVLAWLLRCRLTGTTQSRRQYEDANRSRLCRRKDPHRNPPQYQSFSFCFYRPAPARQSTASWRAGACPRLPYRGCRIWRASP